MSADPTVIPRRAVQHVVQRCQAQGARVVELDRFYRPARIKEIDNVNQPRMRPVVDQDIQIVPSHARKRNIARIDSLPDQLEESIHVLIMPYHTKRAQRGAVVIQQGDGKDPLDLPKNKLEAFVKGVIWREEHFKGQSFRAIAKENGVDESYIRKAINQAMQDY